MQVLEQKQDAREVIDTVEELMPHLERALGMWVRENKGAMTVATRKMRVFLQNHPEEFDPQIFQNIVEDMRILGLCLMQWEECGLVTSLRHERTNGGDLYALERVPEDVVVGLGRLIETDSILPPKNVLRETVGSVSALMASILNQGLKVPLQVRKTKDGSKFELTDEHRRWTAIQNLGARRVACVVHENLDDENAFVQSMILNMQR
ncbi:MAG: ParB N-terminal domain-containing protein [Nitrososphaerota archaeon]|nr:ParB N-terminal domain-containing protein [Nitrososphaerota archaeon]